MTLQGVQAMPGIGIPQAYCLIVTPTGKACAIRAESNGPHSVGMVLQDVEATASVDLPQTDGMIVATAGEGMPIGTEGERPDPIGMAITSELEYAPL